MPTVPIGRAIGWLSARAPSETAVVRGDVRLTRRELDQESDRVARALVARGVVHDDLVGLELTDPLDLLLASVGVWKAGGTPMPLRLRGPERDALLELARPRLVLSSLVRSDSDAPLDVAPASSWKVTPSSGSTGRPALVRATAPAEVDPEGRVAAFVPARAVQLVSGPLAHAAAYTYAMRGLMTGHTLVLMPRFDPADWLDLVEREAVTWAPLNPTTMARIWDVPRRAAVDVSSLESVLHVGARCPEGLKRDWIAWLGPERVTEVYAGSESQGVACIRGDEWLEHPGSVGRGVGGTEFRVLRRDGTRAGPGELGEIVMRRPGTAYSYVGRESTHRGEWHTLGDAGWLDAEGYLHVADRLADLVPTDSGWLVPADVEAVLDAHPEVRSSAVVRTAAGLTAYVEGRPRDLEQWAAARLEPDRRPATYRFVDGPVRDDAGKVRRSTYRD